MSKLSQKGQALFRILVNHVRKPGVNVQRPETLISYGEALELLNLPDDAPRGPTDGKTLQLNGLNDLAQWVNRHPDMPRITGAVISRSEYDGIDGTRRPKNVPGAGYFKEYKRRPDDWRWWIAQMEASIAFDWTPYLLDSVHVASPDQKQRVLEPLRPKEYLRAYDLLIEAGLATKVPLADVPDRLTAHRAYLSQWSFTEGERVVLCLPFHDMDVKDGAIFQYINYRTDTEEHRTWTALQKERAWAMDHAFVAAYKTGRSVRVIVVDGKIGQNGEEQIQRRLLDPVPWHVASYDSTGWCRLERGAKPVKTFTSEEVAFAGLFTEGTQSERIQKGSCFTFYLPCAGGGARRFAR
jgi:hypothetical protein